MTNIKNLVDTMLKYKDAFYYGEYIEDGDVYVYNKLSDKFISYLEKIQSKNTSEYKLACELKKAVERTLIKMLSHKDIGEMVAASLDDFFINCRVLTGKLTDEDYEYIDAVIASPVNDKELDGTVLNGEAYAFDIDYYDEDEEKIYKLIIPASVVVVGSYQVD